MSAATDTVRATAPGNPIGRSIRDSLVITRRNLIRMSRIPEMLIFGLIQPIMFVVLFTYVFGGSIRVGGSLSPQDYREFLMAGISPRPSRSPRRARARASPTICTRVSSTVSARCPWRAARC
ncbi:hypothetical protein GCM10023238_35160 [Streptomyces heliomycini]